MSSLGVPSAFRDSYKLRGGGEAFTKVVRPPYRRVPTVERIGERSRVSKPPGHFHGLPAERCSWLPRRLVSKRSSSESGHQLDSECALLLAQGAQRILKKRDEMPVSSSRLPHRSEER